MYDGKTKKAMCNAKGNLPDADCRFRDGEGNDMKGFGSLMYRPYLGHVSIQHIYGYTILLVHYTLYEDCCQKCVDLKSVLRKSVLLFKCMFPQHTYFRVYNIYISLKSNRIDTL